MGGCLCGDVCLEVLGCFYWVGFCYCLDCCKYYGVLFFVVVIFLYMVVVILGDLWYYGGCFFCFCCGLLVFVCYGDEIEVYLGVLDVLDQLMLIYENWIVCCESWLLLFLFVYYYLGNCEGIGCLEIQCYCL